MKEIKLNMSYKEYMRPALLWATEDTRGLAKALDVKKVLTMGGYIMSLFGGERKKGNERYAGLVVSDLKPTDGGLYIRLYNTNKEYLAPWDLMERYGVDIYRTYYRREINPFKCIPISLILSSYGEEALKDFIEELIEINENVMTEADNRRLNKLIKELKVKKADILHGSHYVIYRGKTTFTACVPEDLNKVVSNSHTSYLECKSAEQAYFYAAVLNYMAHKVIEKRREFVRDQHSKPLVALVAAGLTWRDLPSRLRSKIAKLSYALSKRLSWKKYSIQKAAMRELVDTSEFTQIRELLDKHIESAGKQRMLEGALDLVSGSATVEGFSRAGTYPYVEDSA